MRLLILITHWIPSSHESHFSCHHILSQCHKGAYHHIRGFIYAARKEMVVLFQCDPAVRNNQYRNDQS